MSTYVDLDDNFSKLLSRTVTSSMLYIYATISLLQEKFLTFKLIYKQNKGTRWPVQAK